MAVSDLHPVLTPLPSVFHIFSLLHRRRHAVYLGTQLLPEGLRRGRKQNCPVSGASASTCSTTASSHQLTRFRVTSTGSFSLPSILIVPSPSVSNSHSAPLDAPFPFPLPPALLPLTAALIPLRSFCSSASSAAAVEMTLVLGMRRSWKAARAARIRAVGTLPDVDNRVRWREGMKYLDSSALAM